MTLTDDHLNIFIGHVMLYQDAKYHKVDLDKAKVIAKKYLSHLENHPDACLCRFLDTECAKH